VCLRRVQIQRQAMSQFMGPAVSLEFDSDIKPNYDMFIFQLRYVL